MPELWWVDPNVVICVGIIAFMFGFLAGWALVGELQGDDDERWPHK